MRAVAGTVTVVVLLAGVVVLGADRAHQAPKLRLHAGAAWLASNDVGQLTLVDGASAEVAARVPVAEPGSQLHTSQLGSTGYAVNSRDSSIVRVDGATLQPTRSAIPQLTADTPHAVLATSHTLYVVDQSSYELALVDPVTLTPRVTPHPLAAMTWTDEPMADGTGRLWALDQRTGDLIWFSGDVRYSRARAGTPHDSFLSLADDVPALLDRTRRTVEFLDPDTGAVLHSMRADVPTDDVHLIRGSKQQRKLLVTSTSRRLLVVCAYGADSCTAPIRLGSDGGNLGAPVEANNHVIVPDYAAGHAWIVNLDTMRAIASQQLFDGPYPFELLTHDGVVFYNDPGSHRAGVIELDGRVRTVSKYDPDKTATQVGNSHDTSQRPPSGPATPKPSNVSPATGHGQGSQSGQPGGTKVGIVTRPRDRGLVGEQFELTAVPPGAAGIVTARWTFGDGSEASGITVRHRWDHPGRFPVSVTTTLTTGPPDQVATTMVTIEPPGAPPRVLQLNVDPEEPRIGRPVKFSAVLAGGQTDRWLWTVTGQQGEETTSSLPEFEHTFTVPGAYTVTFTAMAGPIRVQQSRQITVSSEPPDVHCGDILTASATLQKDLVCPNEVAVTIAASDVVLDLGGHLLTTDSPTDKSVGIKVAGPEPITNITIENGRVTKFRTGISVTDTTGGKVSKVVVSSTSREGHRVPEIGADIAGKHARELHLDKVDLVGNIRFVFDGESLVRITDSSIGTNDGRSNVTSGIGARCINGSTCLVQGGGIRLWYLACAMHGDSNSSIAIRDVDIDVRSIGGTCDNIEITKSRKQAGSVHAQTSLTFANNEVFSATSEASQGLSGKSFFITGNKFSTMKVGLILGGGGNGTVAGNTFEGNTDIGLLVTLGVSAQISDNIFLNNGHGDPRPPDSKYGGLVIDGNPLVRGDITVSKNNARHNSGYAIWVHPEAGDVDGGENTSFRDELGCVRVECEMLG